MPFADVDGFDMFLIESAATPAVGEFSPLLGRAFTAAEVEHLQRVHPAPDTEDEDRESGTWTGDCPIDPACVVCGGVDDLTVEVAGPYFNNFSRAVGPWCFTVCQECADEGRSHRFTEAEAVAREADHFGHLGWGDDEDE
ncbi:hypothetical protein [Pseudonocardia charpentierae]|uniref:Uncharacterized protein n=1 Tax=Pseudonocardia charpentierae TaxID=3075545 RepID=A0ABU2NID9_9PSEU|nr:hypothetical protein [Pseudonocardia sp. DSM 45834]MDT0353735.1 hypothetical protein [Pseudonocardia sp. DSM 45834]